MATLSRVGVAVGFLAGWTVAQAGDEETLAISRLEALPCSGKTIGERLAEEILKHSRRDLGWRIFEGEGYLDLERSLRVSKAMEIRYRWRSTASGTLEPISEAAKDLCP